jgi:phosphoglycolate phosphatase
MRYQLIVWDFDGTLADTMALALESYNSLAARHGFTPVEDPASLRGLSTREILRKHGISLLWLPLLMKEYLAATRGRMQDMRLFAGMADIVRTLKAQGCRQGILSSNSADNIHLCLGANGAADLFDFVIGYPRLFGKARAIRRLLKKEQVEPDQCLYIGDEVRDVEAAKKAGVSSAAVGWGFNTAELLLKETPTFFWAAPCDVLPSLTDVP